MRMMLCCLLLTGLVCLGGCSTSLRQNKSDFREGLPFSEERFQPSPLSRRTYPFGTYQIQQRHGLGGWSHEESNTVKE